LPIHILQHPFLKPLNNTSIEPSISQTKGKDPDSNTHIETCKPTTKTKILLTVLLLQLKYSLAREWKTKWCK
jgi:hypothetical protein